LRHVSALCLVHVISTDKTFTNIITGSMHKVHTPVFKLLRGQL